jgi:hypothetical protein
MVCRVKGIEQDDLISSIRYLAALQKQRGRIGWALIHGNGKWLRGGTIPRPGRPTPGITVFKRVEYPLLLEEGQNRETPSDDLVS